MNFLSRARAIAAELLPLSHNSSLKNVVVLYPIAVLQHSSVYTSSSTSAASNKLKSPQQRSSVPKPKTQPPEQSYSSPPLSFPEAHKKPGVDWPRPSEIPWQAKVANSVNLIGHVQIPVQAKPSTDGNYWAGTVISQQDATSPDYPSSFWIPVIFEGDLAHIAYCHLKEKDYVHIAGQLSADPPPFILSQGQANVQVMVHSINFVQGSSQQKKSFVPCKQEESAINCSDKCLSSVKDDDNPANQSMKDLVPKPHKWGDIRSKKGHPMAAAFEHKDNGQLLSGYEGTSEGILKKLECSTIDPKIDQKVLKASTTKDRDQNSSSWRDLLKNPKQWCDHRENKLNGMVKAKHPDFKHKDTGDALWLSSAPTWVLPGLKGLEFDVPLRTMKRVKDKKDLEDDPWKNLVENPHEWWDNRSDKVKAKHPDFKHKDTGVALWLDSAPTWVLPGLEELEFDVPLRTVKQVKEKKDLEDDPWKNLVENPHEWWDNRSNKMTERSPDFKHKDSGKGLWLSRSPAWVQSRLPPLKANQNEAMGKRDEFVSKAI